MLNLRDVQIRFLPDEQHYTGHVNQQPMDLAVIKNWYSLMVAIEDRHTHRGFMTKVLALNCF